MVNSWLESSGQPCICFLMTMTQLTETFLVFMNIYFNHQMRKLIFFYFLSPNVFVYMCSTMGYAFSTNPQDLSSNTAEIFVFMISSKFLKLIFSPTLICFPVIFQVKHMLEMHIFK